MADHNFNLIAKLTINSLDVKKSLDEVLGNILLHPKISDADLQRIKTQISTALQTAITVKSVDISSISRAMADALSKNIGKVGANVDQTITAIEKIVSAISKVPAAFTAMSRQTTTAGTAQPKIDVAVKNMSSLVDGLNSLANELSKTKLTKASENLGTFTSKLSATNEALVTATTVLNNLKIAADNIRGGGVSPKGSTTPGASTVDINAIMQAGAQAFSATQVKFAESLNKLITTVESITRRAEEAAKKPRLGEEPVGRPPGVPPGPAAPASQPPYTPVSLPSGSALETAKRLRSGPSVPTGISRDELTQVHNLLNDLMSNAGRQSKNVVSDVLPRVRKTLADKPGGADLGRFLTEIEQQIVDAGTRASKSGLGESKGTTEAFEERLKAMRTAIVDMKNRGPGAGGVTGDQAKDLQDSLRLLEQDLGRVFRVSILRGQASYVQRVKEELDKNQGAPDTAQETKYAQGLREFNRQAAREMKMGGGERGARSSAFRRPEEEGFGFYPQVEQLFDTSSIKRQRTDLENTYIENIKRIIKSSDTGTEGPSFAEIKKELGIGGRTRSEAGIEYIQKGLLSNPKEGPQLTLENISKIVVSSKINKAFVDTADEASDFARTIASLNAIFKAIARGKGLKELSLAGQMQFAGIAPMQSSVFTGTTNPLSGSSLAAKASRQAMLLVPLQEEVKKGGGSELASGLFKSVEKDISAAGGSAKDLKDSLSIIIAMLQSMEGKSYLENVIKKSTVDRLKGAVSDITKAGAGTPAGDIKTPSLEKLGDLSSAGRAAFDIATSRKMGDKGKLSAFLQGTKGDIGGIDQILQELQRAQELPETSRGDKKAISRSITQLTGFRRLSQDTAAFSTENKALSAETKSILRKPPGILALEGLDPSNVKAALENFSKNLTGTSDDIGKWEKFIQIAKIGRLYAEHTEEFERFNALLREAGAGLKAARVGKTSKDIPVADQIRLIGEQRGPSRADELAGKVISDVLGKGLPLDKGAAGISEAAQKLYAQAEQSSRSPKELLEVLGKVYEKLKTVKPVRPEDAPFLSGLQTSYRDVAKERGSVFEGKKPVSLFGTEALSSVGKNAVELAKATQNPVETLNTWVSQLGETGKSTTDIIAALREAREALVRVAKSSNDLTAEQKTNISATIPVISRAISSYNRSTVPTDLSDREKQIQQYRYLKEGLTAGGDRRSSMKEATTASNALLEVAPRGGFDLSNTESIKILYEYLLKSYKTGQDIAQTLKFVIDQVKSLEGVDPVIKKDSVDRLKLLAKEVSAVGTGLAPAAPMTIHGLDSFKGMGRLAIDIAKDMEKAASPVDRMNEVFKNMKGSSADIKRLLGEAIAALDKAKTDKSLSADQQKMMGATQAQLQTARSTIDKGTGNLPKNMTREQQLAEAGRQIAAAKARVGAGGPSEIIRLQIKTDTGGIETLQVKVRQLKGSLDEAAISAKIVQTAMGSRSDFSTALRRVAVWGTAAGISYGAINALKQAVSTMVDMESATIRVGKVMEGATANWKAFKQEITETAFALSQKYGVSIQDVTESMFTFAQQGLKKPEVFKMAEVATLASNVTNLSAPEAADSLTAAYKQFNMTAVDSGRILDSWNEVANRTAIEENTLAAATKRIGSAAQNAGVSFDEFNGIVAAVGSTTRQTGEMISTSLKFIFQRIQRPEAAGALRQIGVDVKDSGGNFRGFTQIISDLHGKWGDLSDSQQMNIAQAVAGTRQYNTFLVIMEKFADVMDATGFSANSSGSAMRENELVVESTAKRFQILKETVKMAAIQMGSIFLPAAKGIADVLTGVSSALNKMPAGFATLITVIGLASGLMVKFADVADRVLTSLSMVPQGGGFRTALAGIGAATKTEFLSAPKQAQLSTLKAAAEASSGVAATAPLAYALRSGSIGIGDTTKGGWGQLRTATTAALLSEGRPDAAAAIGSMSKGADSLSKFGGAVRNVAVGTGEMNSILVAALLTLTRFVQTAGGVAISAGSQITGGLFKATGAFKAVGVAAATAGLAAKGFLASWLVGGAAIGGVIVLLIKLAEWWGKARETGDESIAGMRESFGKLEEGLSSARKISTSSDSVTKLREKAAKNAALPESEVISKRVSGRYEPPLLLNIEASEKERRSLDGLSFSAVSAIKGFDKLGNAVYKNKDILKSYADTAVSSAAALLAFKKVEAAAAASKEITGSSFWRTTRADALRDAEARRRAFIDAKQGSPTGLPELPESLAPESSKMWKTINLDVTKARAEVEHYKNVLDEMLSTIPKEAPKSFWSSFAVEPGAIESLKTLTKLANIRFAPDLKRPIKDSEVLTGAYLKVQTGLQEVSSAAEVTGAQLEKKFKLKAIEVDAASINSVLSDMSYNMGAFQDSIVMYSTKAGDGLHQARLSFDTDGKAIIEESDSAKNIVSRNFEDLAKNVSGLKIYKKGTIVKAIEEDLLNINKITTGAGAGTVFRGDVNLGARMSFDMTPQQRVAQVNPAIYKEAIKAVLAYEGSLKSIEAQMSTGGEKGEGFGQNVALAASTTIEGLNKLVSALNFNALLVRFATDLASVGIEAEKASDKLKTVKIEQGVENFLSQFKVGAERGVTESGSKFAPSKLSTELTSAEQMSKVFGTTIQKLNLDQEGNKQGADQLVKIEKLQQDLPMMVEEFKRAGVRLRTKDDISAAAKSLSGAASKEQLIATGQASEMLKIQGASRDLLKDSTSYLQRLVEYFTGEKPSEKLTPEQIDAARKGDIQKLYADFASPKKETAEKSTTADISKAKAYKESGNVIQNVIEKYRGKKVSTSSITDEIVENLSKKGVEIRRELKATDRFTAAYDRSMGGFPYLSEEAMESHVLYLKDSKTALEKVLKNLKTPEGRQKFAAGVADVYKNEEGRQRWSQPIKEKEKLPEIKSEQLTDLFKNAYADLIVKIRERISGSTEQVSIGTAFVSAAKGLYDFSTALKNAVVSIQDTIAERRLIDPLLSPVGGAMAGRPTYNPSLVGKEEIDLTAIERLNKDFGPLMQTFNEFETISLPKGTEALKVLQKTIADGAIRIKDLGTTPAGVAVAGKMNELMQKEIGLRDQLRSAMESGRNAMTPLADSIRKLTVVEEARKKIDDLVRSLKMASELRFNEASIDKGLGRHPESRTPTPMGQPRDLNKYERELYELNKKASYGVSAEELSNMDTRRKEIQYNKEEDILQYRQGKENTKFEEQISAAKQTLQTLGEAKERGVGGVEPLIAVLKSELENAGDRIFKPGAGKEGEYYFKGTPSLPGMSDELKRIRDALAASRREETFGGLEEIGKTTNTILGEIKQALDDQKKLVDQAEKVSGENIPGSIATDITTASQSVNTALIGTSKSFDVLKPTLDGAIDAVGRFATSAAEAANKFLFGGKEAPATTPPTGAYTGGFISGKPGIDNVPALLTAGEFVVPAGAAKSLRSSYGGGIFEALKVGRLPGFAGGGWVKDEDLNEPDWLKTGDYGNFGGSSKRYSEFGAGETLQRTVFKDQTDDEKSLAALNNRYYGKNLDGTDKNFGSKSYDEELSLAQNAISSKYSSYRGLSSSGDSNSELSELRGISSKYSADGSSAAAASMGPSAGGKIVLNNESVPKDYYGFGRPLLTENTPLKDFGGGKNFYSNRIPDSRPRSPWLAGAPSAALLATTPVSKEEGPGKYLGVRGGLDDLNEEILAGGHVYDDMVTHESRKARIRPWGGWGVGVNSAALADFDIKSAEENDPLNKIHLVKASRMKDASAVTQKSESWLSVFGPDYEAAKRRGRRPRFAEGGLLPEKGTGLFDQFQWLLDDVKFKKFLEESKFFVPEAFDYGFPEEGIPLPPGPEGFRWRSRYNDETHVNSTGWGDASEEELQKAKVLQDQERYKRGKRILQSVNNPTPTTEKVAKKRLAGFAGGGYVAENDNDWIRAMFGKDMLSFQAPQETKPAQEKEKIPEHFLMGNQKFPTEEALYSAMATKEWLSETGVSKKRGKERDAMTKAWLAAGSPTPTPLHMFPSEAMVRASFERALAKPANPQDEATTQDASNIPGHFLMGNQKFPTEEALYDALLASGRESEVPESYRRDRVKQSEDVFNKKFGKYVTGGFLSGPGGPKSDSIPILASNGEYILKADSVKSIGLSRLEYMNKMGELPKFASGGLAGTTSASSSPNSMIVDASEAIKNIQNAINESMTAGAASLTEALKSFKPELPELKFPEFKFPEMPEVKMPEMPELKITLPPDVEQKLSISMKEGKGGPGAARLEAVEGSLEVGKEKNKELEDRIARIEKEKEDMQRTSQPLNVEQLLSSKFNEFKGVSDTSLNERFSSVQESLKAELNNQVISVRTEMLAEISKTQSDVVGAVAAANAAMSQALSRG